jgi:hypothetical protein
MNEKWMIQRGVEESGVKKIENKWKTREQGKEERGRTMREPRLQNSSSIHSCISGKPARIEEAES